MMGPLAAAWWRLFLMQASWSYERMVGVGVACALEPLLATLPGGRDGARYHAAMRRAAAYFNAHPYFAGLAVGAAARAEHDGASDQDIERLRRALMAPLGALGDQIIWAGVLPAAIGVGIILAVTAGPWWAVGAFLVLYNTAHLVARTWALTAGWRTGRGVAEALATPSVQRAVRWTGPAAALSLGAALPLVIDWLVAGFSFTAGLATAATAALALVLARRLLPSLGGLRYGLVVAAVALVWGWLWP